MAIKKNFIIKSILNLNFIIYLKLNYMSGLDDNWNQDNSDKKTKNK